MKEQRKKNIKENIVKLHTVYEENGAYVLEWQKIFEKIPLLNFKEIEVKFVDICYT